MFKSISRPEFIMIIGPVLLLLLVLELVRRRRLREDYSLLWLVTFALLVILSLFRNSLLEFISVKLLGILYPPTALFVIGFGLMLLIILQFSIVISRLSRQNQQAAQRIALLNARLHELEKRFDRQDAG